MAKNRSSQRGVVRLAASTLLAGIFALFGAAGCSAEGGEAAPPSESVGSVAQALTCGITTCTDFGPCVKVTCDTVIKNTCVYTDAAELTRCKGALSEGVCVTNPRAAHPICCTGCFNQLTKTTFQCVAAPDVADCGIGGSECKNCDGGNTCEQYACKGGECLSGAVPDGEACTDDSGVCSGGKCCSGCLDKNGECQPGDSVTLCGVSTPKTGLVKCESCDDANVCTGDSCVNGVCAAKTPVAGPCNDNTACTTADTCNGLTCGGTPVVCDDKNPCTVDSCDAVKGCVHVAVEAGTSCDGDANKCNGTAKCEGTVCKAIAPVDCDDSNICTTDGCTPATGLCTHTNNTLDCSDNDLCTLVDKCSGGKCVGVGEPNCNDNEACTADTCDESKGCVHTAVDDGTSCNDGNACSTGDKCVAGKCSFVMGTNCNDNNPCTTDACSANVCAPTNVDNGTPCVFDRCHVNSECQSGECTEGEPLKCDDGNPCTTDTCDTKTGCKFTNVDGGDCSDNDACTVSDKCAGGKCVGTAMTCTAIDACHLAGSCNPKTGACDDPRAPNNETECKTAGGEDGVCIDGICNEMGSGGAGSGAGGETGVGGEGTSTGGSAVAQGGEPATGSGGEGNQPTASAGETGEPGKAGSSAGGVDATGDAGSPERPDHVFVRQPGGCSCSVPSSSGSNELAWLAGVALAAAGVVRRRRHARSA